MSFAPTASPDLGLLLDGRYRVEELVARGGMATVYRGHDERLDRTVALKIMHPHLAADPEFRARFTREARSAARLSHPCVVSVFDQGEDAGRIYLAMELVEGRTLRTELSRQGALTVAQVLHVSIAVAQALQAAHRAGIVHRDIKPENILLGADGRVKVADFGLARAIGSSTASTSATLLGTVAYISPEVVTRGQSDERSDFYSFGVVLYEMLTGVQPHTGELPVHVAFQHVHAEMPAPSLRTASVPHQLDSLVTWCCARPAGSRPRDAHELLVALQELAATLPSAVLDAPPLVAEREDTREVPQLTSALDDAVLRQDSPARTFPAQAAPDPVLEDPDSSLRPHSLPAPRPSRGRHLRRNPPGRSTPARLLAALSVLALLAVGSWAGVRWYAMEGPGADRAVPSGVSQNQSTAQAASPGPELTRVPDVFQRPEAEAKSMLEGAGFTVEVVHDKGDPVFGLVYEQSRAGGTQAAQGSTITIRVF